MNFDIIVSVFLSIGSIVLFITASVYWWRCRAYFPIKERSPMVTLFCNGSHVVVLFLSMYDYYLKCGDGIDGNDMTEISYTFLYQFARKLITWPHLFRTLRILVAFRNKALSDKRNDHSRLQSFVIAFLRDEFYIIMSSVLFCAIFTWAEFQYLLHSMEVSGSDSAHQGPYSNNAWVVFSFLEIGFFIMLSFLLRNVNKEHNIMKELGALTLTFFLVNNYSFYLTIRDADWVLCSTELEFHKYLAIRFIVVVLISMVIPLRGASQTSLPLSPGFVLRKFRMFLNEKECLRCFIEFLQVKKPPSDNELLSFVLAMKILKDFDQMNDAETIEELYKTYFAKKVDVVFPENILKEVEDRKAKQGSLSYADLEHAHSHAMKRLESVFEKDFKKTWCHFSLRDRYSDNQLFHQNLIYLNMIKA